jgi:hypothetical protein
MGTAVCAAIFGLIALLSLVVGLRQLVDRPRIALAGEARELDDAMRADGAHHVAGAALALSTFAASIAIIEGTWSIFPLIAFVMLPAQFLALTEWWSLSVFSSWEVTAERPVAT